MAHLTRRLGPAGFTYLVGIDPETEVMVADEDAVFDEEEWTDDDVIDVESREI
jgi:hypothetical protein